MVTAYPSTPLKWQNRIMDHSYWTTTEQRGDNTPRGCRQEALVQMMTSQTERQGMRARKRGRDRTSQSKLSWSLTITSHTFPLPPPYTFLCSKFCFLCFLLWPAAVEAFVQHCFLFSVFPCAASIIAPKQSGVLHLVTLQPIRVELTARPQGKVWK